MANYYTYPGQSIVENFNSLPSPITANGDAGLLYAIAAQAMNGVAVTERTLTTTQFLSGSYPALTPPTYENGARKLPFLEYGSFVTFGDTIYNVLPVALYTIGSSADTLNGEYSISYQSSVTVGGVEVPSIAKGRIVLFDIYTNGATLVPTSGSIQFSSGSVVPSSLMASASRHQFAVMNTGSRLEIVAWFSLDFVQNSELTAGLESIGVSNAKSLGEVLTQISNSYLDKTVSFGGDVSGRYDNITINAGAVGATELANGAVLAEKIANGAVRTDNIADEAISASKIANFAVRGGNSNQISALTITDFNIASNAVTTTKIADKAVTSEKLAPSARAINDMDGGTFTPTDGTVFLDDIVEVDETTGEISVKKIVTGETAVYLLLGMRDSGAIPSTWPAILAGTIYSSGGNVKIGLLPLIEQRLPSSVGGQTFTWMAHKSSANDLYYGISLLGGVPIG